MRKALSRQKVIRRRRLVETAALRRNDFEELNEEQKQKLKALNEKPLDRTQEN